MVMAQFVSHTVAACGAYTRDKGALACNGELLGNLSLSRNQSGFYENGAAQLICVFQGEDAPVSIGIAIDNSASMMPHRGRTRTSYQAFY
jgi:hypothetical protein